MEDYSYLFKVVLIGDSGVGKTCLVRRFTENCFTSHQCDTIGVDFMIKTMQFEGEVVKLQIWDTAGQERFKSITQSYYRAADAIVLVYDVTNAASFESVPQWLRDVTLYARDDVPVYLVGNKCDLVDDRQVLTSTGCELAKLDQLSFVETSAKAADNVDVLFTKMAAMLRGEAIKTGRPAARGMSDSFVVQRASATSIDQKYTCCWLM